MTAGKDVRMTENRASRPQRPPTHPGEILREEFMKVAGPAVRIVDSATTTALAVREVLLSHRLLADGATPKHRVFATGPVDRFTEVARTIFGEKLPEVEGATLT